jgi:SAM-dependent methyltransferase
MRAKENSQISNLNIDFQIADVEDLPYKDDKFDFVLSQFGHMFAPRPEIALKEMLRVLKSGGVVAFSTWPPELLTGRLFTLTGKYNPSAPKDISPPVMWGEVEVIKKRLGRSVRDITFHRAEYGNPALSPAHMRVALEAYIGPIGATIKLLEPNPEKLSEFRNAMEDLLFEYFQNNTVVQSYLMTRAIKN